MLVTIENFNQQEKEIFKQIINTVLKDKFIFINHNPNEFNEILRNSGYFDLNYQTKMLVALAELNELYFRDLSKLFNKYQFIITENYFDCLFINFTQIHFDKKMKDSINNFMIVKPELTIIKINNQDHHNKQKRINELVLKEPQRCKTILNLDKKKLIEHFLFYMKSHTNK